MRNLLRRGRWNSITGWIIAIGFLPAAGAFAAGPRDVERQVREFNISVDGKPCGSSTVRISRRDDNSVRIQGRSDVSVSILAHPYTYSSAGSEVWKNGRLIEKETTSNYNGKRYVVLASPAPDGMQVSVNGSKSKADAGLWVTSYWQLPERLELPATGVRTVEATTGKSGVDVERVAWHCSIRTRAHAGRQPRLCRHRSDQGRRTRDSVHALSHFGRCPGQRLV